MDLLDIAARLDSDEKLNITYRFPIRMADGQVDFETRVGKLLDVAEDANLLYVSHHDDVIWVKAEEVIDVAPICCG